MRTGAAGDRFRPDETKGEISKNSRIYTYTHIEANPYPAYPQKWVSTNTHINLIQFDPQTKMKTRIGEVGRPRVESKYFS